MCLDKLEVLSYYICMEYKNAQNLKNSVLLMGPLGVGKSLLSKKIGEKLNLPVVCLDEVFSLLNILWRSEGCLPSLREWEASQKMIYQNSMGKVKYKKHEMKILRRIAEDYEILMSYKNLFNIQTLALDYASVMRNYQVATRGEDFSTQVFVLVFAQSIILEKIISRLNQPVVLDASGLIGISLTLKKEIDKEGIHFGKGISTQDFQKTLLSRFGTRVFICPGEDFQDRLNDESIELNKLAARSKRSYMQYCDIAVSANGILQRDNPVFLQERDEYNIEQNLEFLKTKNLGEIENLTDQIVASVKEFKQAKEDKIR